MKRAFELKIGGAHIKDLLHARAGVEEGEEQGVVASTMDGAAVYRIKHRADLVTLKIFNGLGPGSLGGNSKKTLAQLEILGVRRGDEPDEGVDGGQSCVARRRFVTSFAFQMIQKGDESFGSQVHEIEFYDGAPMTRSKEAKEKYKSVAVALNGMGTEPPAKGHVLGKEYPQRPGERRGSRAFHSSPPSESNALCAKVDETLDGA
jgi:hypothetical protein